MLPRVCHPTTRSCFTRNLCRRFGNEIQRHRLNPQSRLYQTPSNVVSDAGDTSTATQSMTVIGQVINAEANFVRVRVPVEDLQKREALIHADSDHKELGDVDLLCIVRTVLKKMKSRVLVGDFVKVNSIDWKDARGRVSDVLPRDTELTDPPVANINHFDVLQTTRFLVEAESVGVPVTLAINKVDLPASDGSARELLDRLSTWGYPALMVSCHSGTGIEGCQDILKDKVSAVIGPSGVGKSSLINAMRKDAEMLQQSVNPVSAIGRGRHTTRAVSFLRLSSGGYLVDTPGFNIPDLSAVSSDNLQRMFPEIVRLVDAPGTTRCKFADCQHISEPGCIVTKTEWERHPTYVRLHGEIKEREIYEKEVLQLNKKRREGNVKHKTVRGGVQKQEALLEAKRHRRISRKMESQNLQILVQDETTNIDDPDSMF